MELIAESCELGMGKKAARFFEERLLWISVTV